MFEDYWQMRYKQAQARAKQAENEELACLFMSCCEGNPHVTDEDGNWLTREQVFEKLMRGDEF